MKIHWLHNNSENNSIILFFAGWGVDFYPFEYLTSEFHDVVIFYDYRDFCGNEILPELFDGYENVIVVGWSMGVWAAALLLSEYWDKIAYTVALSGTLKPIHDNFGIPHKTFQATLDNYSLAGRNSFNKRMCRDAVTLSRYVKDQPARDIQDQKEELARLQELIRDTETPLNLFDFAVIGKHDKIIPTDNQISFWEANSIDSKIVDAPHFIFYQWNNWEDLLKDAAED